MSTDNRILPALATKMARNINFILYQRETFEALFAIYLEARKVDE